MVAEQDQHQAQVVLGGVTQAMAAETVAMGVQAVLQGILHQAALAALADMREMAVLAALLFHRDRVQMVVAAVAVAAALEIIVQELILAGAALVAEVLEFLGKAQTALAALADRRQVIPPKGVLVVVAALMALMVGLLDLVRQVFVVAELVILETHQAVWAQ